jgi:hypothetical protein
MWSLHWTENPEERDRNPSAPQIQGVAQSVEHVTYLSRTLPRKSVD